MRRSDLQAAAAQLARTAAHIRRTEKRLRMIGRDRHAEELHIMAGRCDALSSQAFDEVTTMAQQRGRCRDPKCPSANGPAHYHVDR